MIEVLEKQNVVGFESFVLADLPEKRKTKSFDEDKKFYRIGKNTPDEILRVFIEERKSNILTERVNDSLPYAEEMISRSSWEYNKHSEAEKEATINVFSLGKIGCNLVFWVSPDDKGGEGESIYKEGRLNIEFPSFDRDGNWSIYGKHMPLFWDKEESVELAKRLLQCGGTSLKQIEDSEDLRRQPIGFMVEDIDKWVERCRELIPEFSEVWDFIENGGDVENQERMKRDVMEALKQSGGDNYKFEYLMKEMGNEINQDGGHGSAWGGRGEKGIIVTMKSDGTFSYRFGEAGDLNWCDHCRVFYAGDICPLCGMNKENLLAA